MNCLRTVLLAGTLLGPGLSGCDRQPVFSVQVEPLAAPVVGESLAPQLFSHAGRTSLSWLQRDDAGHALYYAEWRDNAWSDARLVVQGDDWFANWADLPGVRPNTDGSWLAWWLQSSGPGTYAYDVQYALSKDGERWQRLGKPHDDNTETEHGFVTIFDAPDGQVGLAWLDGRNTETSGNGHAHHGPSGMTLRYAVLDANGEPASQGEVDGLTCDCCQTDSASTSDATLLVYRDRTAGEIRDIYASRFDNGEWRTPVRVHADNWEIAGCPVNGPAVAADGDLVAVAWFTAPQGKGEVRLALSSDGGRSFGAPVRLDAGRPEGRVDVVMHPEHGVLASWLERTEAGAEVRLRPVTRDGEVGASATLVTMAASRASGFPRLALLDDGTLLMTWTDANETGREVRTARVRL